MFTFFKRRHKAENAEQKGSPTPPPLPDTTADTDDKHAHHTHHHHHPLLKLKEQLSKKSRHPSAIPGSFYERASAFTPHPHVLHIVSPRTTGHVQFRRGKLASWTSALCALSGADLALYPAPVSSTSSTSDHADGESSSGSPAAAAAAEAPSPATPPLAKVHLVGAHLRSGVDRYPTEMSVEEADGVVIALRAPTAEQRDEWLVALGHVSGLFRRVGDYYVLGKSWGHGATSEVQEAVGRFTGRRTAVKKRIKTTREATEAMHNELRILQICAKSPHPAIPSLEDYFFDTDGRIELVMELMDGGELFDWIAERGMLHEMQAKGVFEQVASGVAHLHSLGIAHRDLKPQNLMCVSHDNIPGTNYPRIKIMDYDLAKVNYSRDWEGSTPCGTTHYMAPEVVRRQKYSLAIDCWSMGVILYILLTGKLPFGGRTDAAVEAAINSGNFSMEGGAWLNVSQDAKDLVRGLLNVHPEARLTAEQCLQHPWLAGPKTILEENGAEDGSNSNSVANPPTVNGRPPSAESTGALSTWPSLLATTTSGELCTSENLRLSGSFHGGNDAAAALLQTTASLTRQVSVEESDQGGVLGKLTDRASMVLAGTSLANRGDMPSPISRALEYSLEPVRRREEPGIRGDGAVAAKGNTRSEAVEGEIARLRVSLDLMGTVAGIGDSRAAAIDTGAAAGMPGSPAGIHSLPNDHFADLGALHVEEEDGGCVEAAEEEEDRNFSI